MATRSAKVPGLLAVGLVAAGALGLVLYVWARPGDSTAASRTDSVENGSTDIATPTRVAFDMPTCDGEAVNSAVPAQRGNPKARAAAQKGLDYLGTATASWQQKNDCYGCHVQAVTLEALSVGRANQYDVGASDFATVLKGMLELKGGARHKTGLGYTHPGGIYDTGKVFGTAAFARYDQLVDQSQESVLLAEAGKLLEMQQSAGRLTTGYSNAPVAISGDVQTTALAVVAWKQAYERSADSRWRTAIANAEDYLSGVVSGWKKAPVAEIQQINYAVVGLLAAGAGADEAVMVRLAGELRERQNQDGGWALHGQGSSAALATGQTLYVLRLLGMTDGDKLVHDGQAWLIKNQLNDGSWSAGGFGKAEAMWSVLGLVSMDVLTVSVAGLSSGERLDGPRDVTMLARDNEAGGGVVKVELFVDDVRAAGACGAKLSHRLDPAALGAGPYLIDVQATNASGKTSRRRFEVFGPGVYLTRAGTRYTGGATEVSVRDIAPQSDKHDVLLEVYEANENGEVVGKVVHQETRTGAQGSLSFNFSAAKASATGKFVARLIAKNGAGKELQREDVVFVHATREIQQARWGEIEGDLSLEDGEFSGANENAEVELVDENGNVVARTRSTRSGRYRFKNVAPGKDFKVRVQKQGWAAPAAAVRSAAGSAAKADVKAKRKR